MSSIFTTPPDTDLSNLVFEKLFGANWWDLSSQELSGIILPFLSDLNRLFAMLIGSYAVLSIIKAVLGTANDGVVGGSRQKNFWQWGRIFGSLGMTMPVKAGLSAFQLMMLSALGLSCNFANSTYDLFLDHIVRSNMSQISTTAPAYITQEGEEIAKKLARVVGVQYTMAERDKAFVEVQRVNNGADFSYLAEGFSAFKDTQYNQDVGAYIITFNVGRTCGLASPDLGQIRISGAEKDPLCIAKFDAIFAMYSIISSAIEMIRDKQEPQQGWLKKAVKTYEKAYLSVANNMNSLPYYAGLDVTQQVNSFKEKARELGWMAAGGWPLLMSSVAQQARDALNQPVEIVKMDKIRVAGLLKDFYVSNTPIILKTELLSSHEPSPTSPGMSVAEAVKSGQFPALDGFFRWGSGRMVLAEVIESFEEEGAILTIPRIGHMFIDASIALWTAGLVLASVDGAQSGFANSAWGWVAGFVSGGSLQAASTAGSRIAAYIGKTLKTLVDGLFFAGILLAYVVPMLPTLYWIIAMVGFILLAVEVLVAAPFWLAAHAWSQDEGFSGEMGKQGYFQFLEILFKPALLVLGFIVVFLIMDAAGFILARIFETYYFSYANSDISLISHTGLITNIVMILIVAALNCYLLFYLCSEGYSHLCKNVLTWVGHQTTSLGLAGHAEGMRQLIVGSVGQTTGAPGYGKTGGNIGPSGTGSGEAGETEKGKIKPKSDIY